MLVLAGFFIGVCVAQHVLLVGKPCAHQTHKRSIVAPFSAGVQLDAERGFFQFKPVSQPVRLGQVTSKENPRTNEVNAKTHERLECKQNASGVQLIPRLTRETMAVVLRLTSAPMVCRVAAVPLGEELHSIQGHEHFLDVPEHGVLIGTHVGPRDFA